MIPLGVVRLTTVVLGGLVPAFASFKALEHEDAAAQRVLLTYWCVFALVSAAELPADAALSWLPLYGETKLALVLWLLTPHFTGAMLVYRGVLAGWLRRHRATIEHGLQHLHLHHGIWAVAALLRGMFGLLLSLVRAAWLMAPPAHAQTSPAPLSPQHGPALQPAVADCPGSARPAPLDTAPVRLLSAGLEESCAMLLRTALAAQAGNQLLASLHSQAAILGQSPPPPGAQRRRHGRRRTITATTASGTGPTEEGRSASPLESSDASIYSAPPATGPPRHRDRPRPEAETNAALP